MRLHSLTLEAFGPFPGREHIDFDALDTDSHPAVIDKAWEHGDVDVAVDEEPMLVVGVAQRSQSREVDAGRDVGEQNRAIRGVDRVEHSVVGADVQ